MTPITKGLVVGMTAAAQSHTGIFPNKLAAFLNHSHWAANEQGSVWPRFNGRRGLHYVRDVACGHLEMQCAGWACSNHRCNLIHFGCIQMHPRAGLWLEYLWETMSAITGMNT